MNSESKRTLKEFTFGYLGPKRFRNQYFSFIYITFTYREFVIRPLFRKISIPIENIEKVNSEEKLLLSGSPHWSPIYKWLKITHNNQKLPKDIYFTTTDFDTWFSAFEKRGILTEDELGLRNCDNSQLKIERSLKFPAGIFVCLALILGSLDVIIQNLKWDKGIISWILNGGYYFVIFGISISVIRILIYNFKIFLNTKISRTVS